MAKVNKNGIDEKMTRDANMDGSSLSTFASMVGMVLTTIALGGMRTYWMAAFAVLAVSLAQLFEAGMLSSRFSGSPGLVTGRLPAGIAGIVLGLLSLLGVFTKILLPVSSILFGLVLILGSWAIVRLIDNYTAKACEQDEMHGVVRAAARIVGTLEAFIGCGSIALGILALTGMGLTPVPLTLVATFGIGFSSLLNATILGGRVLSSLHCNRLPAV